ncbi:hypothetical protein [Microbacterium sp. T2.11-28]|uniref:hypothetical protein n=1 Tax=unclassified Microbacterium TaxID=2609290 RepID=UPI0024779F2E|nr:hypothetical protein [Microbacterium sp. T2.11-28]CAI9389179.1 hypothetical protein MICABA_01009 [Microbacterium sp. T2.11-28]
MSASDWSAELDRFERDLESPEPGPWAPCPSLGPLPPHLVERARSIAARQLARTAHLRGELAAVRAQLDAARLIPGTRTDDAAYVERDG